MDDPRKLEDVLGDYLAAVSERDATSRQKSLKVSLCDRGLSAARIA